MSRIKQVTRFVCRRTWRMVSRVVTASLIVFSKTNKLSLRCNNNSDIMERAQYSWYVHFLRETGTKN